MCTSYCPVHKPTIRSCEIDELMSLKHTSSKTILDVRLPNKRDPPMTSRIFELSAASNNISRRETKASVHWSRNIANTRPRDSITHFTIILSSKKAREPSFVERD